MSVTRGEFLVGVGGAMIAPCDGFPLRDSAASPVDKLLKYWGHQPAPGVDIREIDEFESKNGVRMPSDFREYFLRTNGLGRDGLDPEMFAFWTLDMLERRENTQVFIFADFMTQCWCYAVDLGGEREPKFSVYRDMPDGWVRVGSFAEFVDLYVAGDFDMWTPAGWPHSYDCVNL